VSGVVYWLSKDPIGISGGLNLYAFCGNNPVNFVDPYGRMALAPRAIEYFNSGKAQQHYDIASAAADHWGINIDDIIDWWKESDEPTLSESLKGGWKNLTDAVKKDLSDLKDLLTGDDDDCGGKQ
jgi:uncharacterized protein RhaS with RHS repeats